MSFRMRRASSIERSGKAAVYFSLPMGRLPMAPPPHPPFALMSNRYIYIYIHIYIYYIYIYIHIIIYMGAKHNMPSGR